jgi:phosphoribosylformylglycinamidine synthase
MSFFRCLPGADALSAFRQQRLLASLAEKGLVLDSIQAQYLHFVWSEAALSDAQCVVLEGLLTYGKPFTLAEPSARARFSRSRNSFTSVLPVIVHLQCESSARASTGPQKAHIQEP